MIRYKVLVVDDSAFMRKLITELISEDPEFEVIATAKNGKEAVDLTERLRPDVITMDVEMPVMNGIEALQAIMAKCPTPVIMLSSLTASGSEYTILALEYGAVDFLQKPSGSISVDLYKVKEALLSKLHIALNAKVRKGTRIPPVGAIKPNAALQTAQQKPVGDHGGTAGGFRHLVAIGTSTGGPKALQNVLPALPKDYPAPILIVQHMPPNFTRSLAQRLNLLSNIRVLEAEQGMPVERGTAYIAPGDWHLRLTRKGASSYVIQLTKEDPRNGHRPSVDVLFESLEEMKELTRHLVILTGMGGDGARAMKRLRAAGAATTIAESEETCVVYGMPKVAVELQAAMHVLPLYDIPRKLIECVGYDRTYSSPGGVGNGVQ